MKNSLSPIKFDEEFIKNDGLQPAPNVNLVAAGSVKRQPVRKGQFAFSILGPPVKANDNRPYEIGLLEPRVITDLIAASDHEADRLVIFFSCFALRPCIDHTVNVK